MARTETRFNLRVNVELKTLRKFNPWTTCDIQGSERIKDYYGHMRKKKENKEAREERLKVEEMTRKRNRASYFLETSRWHREWLVELAERYKKNGDFPISSKILLPSYYAEPEDKEVAIFASLLMSDSKDVLQKVSAFREMLGASPWEWFKERGFVPLSLGSTQNLRTGGIANWKIARLFDRLWEQCRVESNSIRPIGHEVSRIAGLRHCSHFEVLSPMLKDCSVGDHLYKIRLLLMILGTADGFGQGVWEIDPLELRCPLTGDLRLFLGTFFPDHRMYGNMDEAIRLFGFERDCDFFYAYLGYKELQKRNPIECRECATRYIWRYTRGSMYKPYEWRAILPQISI